MYIEPQSIISRYLSVEGAIEAQQNLQPQYLKTLSLGRLVSRLNKNMPTWEREMLVSIIVSFYFQAVKENNLPSDLETYLGFIQNVQLAFNTACAAQGNGEEHASEASTHIDAVNWLLQFLCQEKGYFDIRPTGYDRKTLESLRLSVEALENFYSMYGLKGENVAFVPLANGAVPIGLAASKLYQHTNAYPIRLSLRKGLDNRPTAPRGLREYILNHYECIVIWDEDTTTAHGLGLTKIFFQNGLKRGRDGHDPVILVGSSNPTNSAKGVVNQLNIKYNYLLRP